MEARSFVSEVEKRIDELFGEDSPDPKYSDSSVEVLTEADIIDEDSILSGLRAAMLSIDWEIREDYLNDLMIESHKLRTEFSGDKPLCMLLQMMEAISKYLLKRKAQARPEAITLLKSVYESVEKIVGNDLVSEEDKQYLVSSRLAEFNELKQKIIGATKKEKVAEEPKEVQPEEERAVSVREYRKEEPREEGELERVVPRELGVPKDAVFQEQEREEAGMGMPEEGEQEGHIHRRYAGFAPHEAFAYAIEEIKEVIRAEMRAIRAEIRLWRESG